MKYEAGKGGGSRHNGQWHRIEARWERLVCSCLQVRLDVA